MTTKEMIAVMEHFDKGGKIEARNKNLKYDWDNSPHPVWNFDRFEYRIKSEPKVIPWTVENAPLSIKVLDKDEEIKALFLDTVLKCYRQIGYIPEYSFDYLSENYIQTNGSPCGTISNE